MEFRSNETQRLRETLLTSGLATLNPPYDYPSHHVGYRLSSDSRSEVVGREGRSNLWSGWWGRNGRRKSIRPRRSYGLSHRPNRRLAESYCPGNRIQRVFCSAGEKDRSEEDTPELQSQSNHGCRPLPCTKIRIY